jgi:hypothetical protein
MTDLIVVSQQTKWNKLKALVLDRASSPIAKRIYNLRGAWPGKPALSARCR